MLDSNYSNFDLREDLINSLIITHKCRQSNSYAQNLYASLCNNVFQKTDVIEILKDQRWYCSWRTAGAIVSKIVNEGDYMDWYCSGIQDDDKLLACNFITEGSMSDEIEKDLNSLGWACITKNKN